MRSTTHMRLEDCAAVATGRIRFYVALKGGGRAPMLGRVVDVASHLSATFVLHKAASPDMGWCVSDTETGCRVGWSLGEGDAVSLAAANLATRSDADLRRAREQRRQAVESI